MSMISWPFVSRTRYADREREILELKRELAEVRHKYDRVVDRINYRSTGFHLDDRFAAEDAHEPAEVKAAQPDESPAEPTGIAAAIHAVGNRPSAIRSYLEQTAQKEFQEKEKAWEEKRLTSLRAQALDRMEEALKGKPEPEPAARSSQTRA